MNFYQENIDRETDDEGQDDVGCRLNPVYIEYLDIETLFNSLPARIRYKFSASFTLEIKDAVYLSVGDEYYVKTNLFVRRSHPGCYMFIQGDLSGLADNIRRGMMIQNGIVSPDVNGQIRMKVVNGSNFPLFLPAKTTLGHLIIEPYLY